MNKFELRALGTAGIVVIIFLTSLLYNAYSRKINVPACVPLSQQSTYFKNPGLKQLDDSTFDLYIVAQMWAFNPGEVTVPKGSTVNVFVTSKDVVHGFLIDRKAVNLMIIPGAINTATIKFNKAGNYHMVCHEYCGIGHQNMLGNIVVTE
jgi:cytochrome c oxidase subunit 2